MELNDLAEKAREKFGSRRPPKAELIRWAAALDAGVGIAIITLLFTMWAYFNPKPGDPPPKCRHVVGPGKKCNQQFLAPKIEEPFLVLVCFDGHVTRKRIKR